MAGGKVFPRAMVPESVISGMNSSSPDIMIESEARNIFNSPSSTPMPVPQKLILHESERMNLNLKRKRTGMRAPTYELNRRVIVRQREVSVNDRKQELQKIFNGVEVDTTERPPAKKQKHEREVTKEPAPKSGHNSQPRKAVMRTEIIPMLPCKGYTLPLQKTSGNVVYIGGRDQTEGLAWRATTERRGDVSLHEIEDELEDGEVNDDDPDDFWDESVDNISDEYEDENEESLVHEILLESEY